MTAFDRLAIVAIILAGLLLSAVLGLHHYGAERYNDGYSAAVAIGKKQHDRDVAAANQIEIDLRSKLAAQDAEANRREQEYASNLEAAQRRVRAGTDRLRCPASPVHDSATPADRSASAEPTTDGSGPDLVPEAAADVLGYGAAIASLVRRYEQVVERFKACRAVNAK
jgi:hypothetical protein